MIVYLPGYPSTNFVSTHVVGTLFMKSSKIGFASVRLLGARAKFWIGFWKSMAVAIWKQSVVLLIFPLLLLLCILLFMNPPPYSIHPILFLINGCRVEAKAS